MAESLKGKVAVITGVGSGFAKATAELFASKDQVNLVMIDLDEKALEATAKACKASGSKVIAFQGDVTKPETFTKALKETLDNFGKIDFLINYAGGALKVAPIEEMDDDINRRIIDLNLGEKDAGIVLDHRIFHFEAGVLLEARPIAGNHGRRCEQHPYHALFGGFGASGETLQDRRCTDDYRARCGALDKIAA